MVHHDRDDDAGGSGSFATFLSEDRDLSQLTEIETKN